MNYSENDIEYYLLNKEYIELNSVERAFVSKEINSEEQYNELKKLFSSFNNNSIAKNTIEPNSTIKTNLIAEFKQHNNQNKIWLNSVFTGLFPKEKKIISMPGTQLVGIAASLLIIITIYTNYEFNNNPSTLTLSEDQVNILATEQPTLLEPIIEKNLNTTTLDNNTLAKNEEIVIAHNEISLNTDLEESIVITEDEADVVEFVEIIEFESNEIDLELASPAEELELTLNDYEGFDLGELATPTVSEELVLSGYTNPNVSSRMESTPNKLKTINKDFKTITTSRSLKEDEELIALFYTAL
jgi:hypothetical protein|tara:strand:+ start:394 stop:1293 length:900 start_codon:yes stop_codon:yes gene_type:complete